MTTLDGLKSHDSILSKLDTFKRKKKKELQEVVDLTEESNQAINISVNPLTLYDQKDYQLQEGEERSFIEKASQLSHGVQELTNRLLTWINNELAEQRIIVRDLQEDLFDGQILQKLVEKLTKLKLDHPELTQTELGQLQRLGKVLATINQLLQLNDTLASQSWTAELIHQKDLIAILRLLVALAEKFKPGMHFQPGIFLTVIVVRKLNGKLERRYSNEFITDVARPDTIGHPLDMSPEPELVMESLVQFCNFHLDQLSLKVSDAEKDFADGVYLIQLMGLLNGYFVPFHTYHVTPTTEDMKLHNVGLAFELMQSAGLAKPPAEPEEIVDANKKAILRVLYRIYMHYRNFQEREAYYDDPVPVAPVRYVAGPGRMSELHEEEDESYIENLSAGEDLDHY